MSTVFHYPVQKLGLILFPSYHSIVLSSLLTHEVTPSSPHACSHPCFLKVADDAPGNPQNPLSPSERHRQPVSLFESFHYLAFQGILYLVHCFYKSVYIMFLISSYFCFCKSLQLLKLVDSLGHGGG
ncbi:hypothetical protein ACOSQ4_017948 [Xanthoceras sorbifolium]